MAWTRPISYNGYKAFEIEQFATKLYPEVKENA
jgi:hypothetical protein